MPPLRNRKEDIPLLANHYLKFYAEENGFPPPELSSEALRLMMDYEWPVNVRELERKIGELLTTWDDGLTEAFAAMMGRAEGATRLAAGT